MLRGVEKDVMCVVVWSINVPSVVMRAHNLLDCETFTRVEARGNKLMSTKLLSTDSNGGW